MTAFQEKHQHHWHFDESNVLHVFSMVLMVVVFLLCLSLVLTIGGLRPGSNNYSSGSQNYPLPITPWD